MSRLAPFNTAPPISGSWVGKNLLVLLGSIIVSFWGSWLLEDVSNRDLTDIHDGLGNAFIDAVGATIVVASAYFFVFLPGAGAVLLIVTWSSKRTASRAKLRLVGLLSVPLFASGILISGLPEDLGDGVFYLGAGALFGIVVRLPEYSRR